MQKQSKGRDRYANKDNYMAQFPDAPLTKEATQNLGLTYSSIHICQLAGISTKATPKIRF